MIEKMRSTAIWVSPDTYRELLQIEKILLTQNGASINPSDAIRELIKSWKKSGFFLQIPSFGDAKEGRVKNAKHRNSRKTERIHRNREYKKNPHTIT